MKTDIELKQMTNQELRKERDKFKQILSEERLKTANSKPLEVGKISKDSEIRNYKMIKEIKTYLNLINKELASPGPRQSD